MDLASALEDRTRTRALFTWNNNVAASSPEQARLRRALAADDLLHVAVDLFHTDTTAYADYVLPAASFLEFDDLVASYFELTLSAQVKAQEPLGDSLPNQEIFRRLATAMGFEEAELQESDDDLIAGMLAESGVVDSFADLAARGTVPLTADPVVQFADRTFPTPSGRVELASAAAAADGHSRVPLPLADITAALSWRGLPYAWRDRAAHELRRHPRLAAQVGRALGKPPSREES